MAAELTTEAIAALITALLPFAPPDTGPQTLEAWAVACIDATPHGCAVLADPGHGAITIEFRRGWPAGVIPAPRHLPTPRPKHFDLD